MTQIVADTGGYIISSQTAMKDNYKTATLNVAVPSDEFEMVQRRVRQIALVVLRDTAEGKDVTDEYVDLESRLKNLEATEARIREFLAQAKTVDEALKVNQQLSDVQGQIEQVKGRMNFINDRAACSDTLDRHRAAAAYAHPVADPDRHTHAHARGLAARRDVQRGHLGAGRDQQDTGRHGNLGRGRVWAFHRSGHRLLLAGARRPTRPPITPSGPGIYAANGAADSPAARGPANGFLTPPKGPREPFIRFRARVDRLRPAANQEPGR